MVLNYAKCIVLMLVLVNIDIKVVVCHLSERKSRTAICIENNSRVRRDLQRDHVEDLLADRETVKTENQVAYFSGQEIIRYSNIYFNIDIFTIQFYVQVEGGQIDKVPLIKIYDHCALTEITSTTIGLQEMSEGKDLRMYFELLTASGNITKSLSSHTALEVRKWLHVAAIYDGKSMQLFINQAKVDATYELNGLFLSKSFHKCTSLEIGGDSKKHITFRGSIDEIKLWNIAKSHQDVFDSMNDVDSTDKRPSIFYEGFNGKNSNNRYYGVTGLTPELQISKIDHNSQNIEIQIPNCGITICDNPEIIKNYENTKYMLTTSKTINYRVIKLTNDDGSNPLLTDAEIIKKDKEINKIYNNYNISFKLLIHEMRNTSLRNKTIVLRCYNHCLDNPMACKSAKDMPKCTNVCNVSDIGNKICNPECNNVGYKHENMSWDGGDCCNPSYTNISETCYDTNSPNRAFLRDSELKDIINLDNRYYLNIYPVKLKTNTLGKGTFPWVPDVYGKHGGTVINIDSFLNDFPADIIHELGHNFGLWHVHKGVSEYRCDDTCVEDKPSMRHGDLCDDTNPTPINSRCQDEVQAKKCGFRKYTNTPFRNYMGYTSGSCVTNFTPQQKARMHCYIDHYYEEWQEGAVPPSPIPLPPRILSASKNKVTVTWMPPIGCGKEYSRRRCNRCDPENRMLKQYASSASSPNENENSREERSPSKATGPPDVLSVCNADPHAWLRKDSCKEPNCYLELSFSKVVIPTAIKIWVTYNPKDAIKDIQLFHTDGNSTSLGPGTTQCDVPYTRPITTEKPVSRVRVYVHGNPRKPVGIDSVQLVSEKHHRQCHRCEKLRLMYNVHRKPAFTNKKKYRRVSGLRFEDGEIEKGQIYEYRIQSTSGNQQSRLSPPLVYKMTDGYCGNGVVEPSLGEECDDRNLRNGDGCDTQCKKEVTFNCKRQPSLCYRHDRDGICEDFERRTNIHDCGYYTPNGFIDQWAKTVVGTKDQSKESCPEGVIAGKPDSIQQCSSSFFYIVNRKLSWQPCKRKYSKREPIKRYSIEATFEKEVVAAAVIIYLAHDGVVRRNHESVLDIELKDMQGVYHKASEKRVAAKCADNPLSIHVLHDMTKPIFKTKSVRISFGRNSAKIAISAIALRSADTDYLTRDCISGEIFDRDTKKCRAYKLESLACKKFSMKHAHYKCASNDEGARCSVKCEKGYVPRKEFNVTCQHGRWRIPSHCTPVDCGKLTLRYSSVECPSTTYGSICTFKCNKNAHLHGTNNEAVCKQDGRWDIGESRCYVTCDKPGHVTNSVFYTTDSIVNECADETKKVFSMGARCRFQCLPGYRPVRYITGSVTGGNTVNIFCDGSGKWQRDGYCEKISCSTLTTYNMHLYTCTDGYRYKSVCSTNCLGTREKDYRVTCLQNGEWSSTFDVCEKAGRCDTLPSSKVVDANSCHNNAIGAICRPQCLRWKDGTIPDIVNKNSKRPNKEVVIHCMPNKKWLPSFDDLDCVKPCTDRLGDSFCDCENNNEHCRYDGGDCCGSDVTFMKEPRCSCIDPVVLARLKLNDKFEGSGSGDDLIQDDSERDQGES